MTYLVDTRKLFRIWYSHDQRFLGLENQLRFIKLRNDNPNAEIYFIYSSSCLSIRSYQDMISFCDAQNIYPIDFDTDIKNQLKSKSDKKIYQIAKKEIERALDGTGGGNLASASDGTRILKVVLERYGSYSDFDVEVKFARFPKHISILTPIIIPGTLSYKNELGFFITSNDFLITSVKKRDLNRLSSPARKRISDLQAEFLKRYQQAPYLSISSGFVPYHRSVIEMGKNLILRSIAEQYYHNFPDADVFEFRSFLKNFDFNQLVNYLRNSQGKDFLTIFELSSCDFDSEALKERIVQLLRSNNLDKHEHLSYDEIISTWLQNVIHNLYLLTVINVSGPTAFRGIFNKEIEALPEKHDNHFSTYRQKLEKRFSKFLLKNSPLNDYVKSSINDIGTGVGSNDLSWTRYGQNMAEYRESKLIQAGNLILNAHRMVTARLKFKAFLESQKSESESEAHREHIGSPSNKVAL